MRCQINQAPKRIREDNKIRTQKKLYLVLCTLAGGSVRGGARGCVCARARVRPSTPRGAAPATSAMSRDVMEVPTTQTSTAASRGANPQAAKWLDNPAAPTPAQHNGEPPCLTQLAIRETVGVEWPGFLMLLPPLAPRYLLVPDMTASKLRAFDLLRPSGPGVVVLHGSDIYVVTAAASADGASIFLGCFGRGGLRVYDTAPLLALAARLPEGGEAEFDDQIAPRALAPNPEGIKGRSTCTGAAFSKDVDRLFILWKREGDITVHDPRKPTLPMLRVLRFVGYNYHTSNYQLACAGGLLAAAAGGGDTSGAPSSTEEAHLRRRVQLWRVDADGETELRTVKTPDLADSVAIRSDGELVAIGLRNGVVWLLAPQAKDALGGEQEDFVELKASMEGNGSPMAHALCFSLDGSKLVVGRDVSEDFTIYDVASAAAVGRFVRPKSQGYGATFSPAADVLVTSSYTSGPAQQCVFHRLLPPSPYLDLAMSTVSVITQLDVVWGGEQRWIVAMAARSKLEVHAENGKMLAQDLGEAIATPTPVFTSAVKLHPHGRFVACMLHRAAVVLSVTDGSEVLRVPKQRGTVFTLAWSPDGALLVMAGSSWIKVFSKEEGFAEVLTHAGNTDPVFSLAFDRAGARLATGSASGRLTVWDVSTWTPTQTFEVESMLNVLCFSWSGDKIAHLQNENLQVSVLSLAADSVGEHQVVCTQVNALGNLMFSPDDKFLLCCPSMGRTFDQNRMRVLDLASGTDAYWGELLRTMALPVTDGTLSGYTLGWTQVSQSQALNANALDIAIDASWVLYGAVGKRMVVVDVHEALRAIDDDAWTAKQLAFCSAHQQERVGTLLKSALHCSSIRDTVTGQTAVHLLTLSQQVEPLKKWLEVCTNVPPVADGQGQTPVQLALQLDHLELAQTLWQNLPPPWAMTSVSASLLLQDLKLLCKTSPHLVESFLLDVEPAVVRTVTTFRTELERAMEVRGQATCDEGHNDKMKFDIEKLTTKVPSVWADRCPADSAKTLVAWRVVLVPDLLGDAQSSPFHDIVASCEASTFKSKLLQMIVQYKWEENVQSHRMRSMALYIATFLIGAVAMVLSVTNDDLGAIAFNVVDVLQGLAATVELLSLLMETFQLAREGYSTYFTGPWNLLDIMSSGLLLVGSLCHFMRASGGVRAAGALGVAMKSFGLIDYLRSFSTTGSLIRMISVILTDMVPFMTILLLMMLGCTMFFVINMPSSPQFGSDSTLGPFRPLVTVVHMTLGIGQGVDVAGASVITVLMVTFCMSFIVVVLLNLLIAIMGDSYEKVKESERVEAIRERAQIIVEHEKRFPRSHQYHRFMHYLEAVDSTGSSAKVVWEGITMRLARMITTETDRLDSDLAAVKGELVEVKGKLVEVNGKLDLILEGLK